MDTNPSRLAPKQYLAAHFQPDGLLLNEESFSSSSPSSSLLEAVRSYNRFVQADEPIRIGLLGLRGNGKSNLVNRLLGCKLVPSGLAIGDSTQWPVEVSYGPNWTLKTDPPEASAWIPPVSDAESILSALKHLNVYQEQARDKKLMDSLSKRSKSNDSAPATPSVLHPFAKKAMITAPIELLRSGIVLIDIPGYLNTEFDNEFVVPSARSVHCAILVEARLPASMGINYLLKRGGACAAIGGACFFGDAPDAPKLLEMFNQRVLDTLKEWFFSVRNVTELLPEQLSALYDPFCFVVNRQEEAVSTLPPREQLVTAHRNSLLLHVAMLKMIGNECAPPISFNCTEEDRPIESRLMRSHIRVACNRSISDHCMHLAPKSFLSIQHHKSFEEAIQFVADAASAFYWTRMFDECMELIAKVAFCGLKVDSEEAAVGRDAKFKDVDVPTRFKIALFFSKYLSLAKQKQAEAKAEIEAKISELWKDDAPAEILVEVTPEVRKGKKRIPAKTMMVPNEKPYRGYDADYDPAFQEYIQWLKSKYPQAVQDIAQEIVQKLLQL